MIYRKDLCTYTEFKDSMNRAQRQEYLNKIYGDTAAHMVLAKIKDITSVVVKIEAIYFILNGNILQKFCLCRDTPMSNIGSTGYHDRNFQRDNIIGYCQQKNFSIGDEITCEIFADERYPMTFFLTSMEKVNIANLRDYLFTAFELRYSYEILEMVYLALQTNQLILLVGEPGTGKTSLARYLAKAFNFEDAAIIAVQSNWTDKSDLLGYYNPLEKNYVATPFLDALIKFSKQAEKHPDKLYIICLDEMNLAHVEYYFAEFLSILQDTRRVRLYSNALRQDILNELKHSGFVKEDEEIFYEDTPLENLTLTSRRYYFELCRLAQMLNNYPAEFAIPANVKFFGTLNQDETTLDISPKVLDRSFVIRLETYDAIQNFSGNTKPACDKSIFT